MSKCAKSRLVLHVPEKLHKLLKAKVAMEGISMTQFVTDAIRKWVSEEPEVNFKARHSADPSSLPSNWNFRSPKKQSLRETLDEHPEPSRPPQRAPEPVEDEFAGEVFVSGDQPADDDVYPF